MLRSDIGEHTNQRQLQWLPFTPGCERAGAAMDVFLECPGRKEEAAPILHCPPPACATEHSPPWPRRCTVEACMPDGLPCPDAVETRGVTLSLQFVRQMEEGERGAKICWNILERLVSESPLCPACSAHPQTQCFQGFLGLLKCLPKKFSFYVTQQQRNELNTWN